MANIGKAVEDMVNSIDQYQRAHHKLSFVIAVLKKYNEDSAGYSAALLTYYGFISLFPLLLVATTVLKMLLRNNQVLRDKIIRGSLDYFPIIGQELRQNVHGLGTSGSALVVGLILTFYGVRSVADVLRTVLDHIWIVPDADRSAFPRSFLQSAVTIIVGGVGFAFAPFISSYAYVIGKTEIFRVVSIMITLVILFITLLVIMLVSMSIRRPIKDLWTGALLGAIGLALLENIGGYILSHQIRHLNSLYGAFALVLGLLYWIYLQAQVLLFAFEIDSVRVLQLWPRSINQPLTIADRKVRQLNLYSHGPDDN